MWQWQENQSCLTNFYAIAAAKTFDKNSNKDN